MKYVLASSHILQQTFPDRQSELCNGLLSWKVLLCHLGHLYSDKEKNLSQLEHTHYLVRYSMFVKINDLVLEYSVSDLWLN